MNREQIEGFTREAGGFDATPEFLERFAKLVAEHERGACADLCEKYGFDNHCGTTTDVIATAIRASGNKHD